MTTRINIDSRNGGQVEVIVRDTFAGKTQTERDVVEPGEVRDFYITDSRSLESIATIGGTTAQVTVDAHAGWPVNVIVRGPATVVQQIVEAGAEQAFALSGSAWLSSITELNRTTPVE